MNEIERYGAFAAANGPDWRPRPWIEHERELAIWTENTGYQRASGLLPATDSDRVGRIPGWADSPADRRFLETLREYALFLAESDGVHPRMSGAGTTPYERRLGVWATRCRKVLKTPDGEVVDGRLDRVALLREHASGLLDNGFRSWERSIGQFLAWVEFNEEWPTDSDEAPEAERRLASWLRRQRWMFSLDQLDASRKERLDQVLVGWRDSVDVSFESRLERFKAWIVKNGGCAPRPTTENKTEAFWYQWHSTQCELDRNGLLDEDRSNAFGKLRMRAQHTPQCRHTNTPRKREWRYAV
ncbi:hypothetical protein [Agromyces subbeticus]|uniref:hypothetical protein n=1 Tax=Agromyces subbeticus TaxID=293890 RepID=UPI0003B6EE19|nr:hypothetical protein [Agromyces subbeticus]